MVDARYVTILVVGLGLTFTACDDNAGITATTDGSSIDSIADSAAVDTKEDIAPADSGEQDTAPQDLGAPSTCEPGEGCFEESCDSGRP